MVQSASSANTSTQSAVIQSKYILTPTVNNIGQVTAKKKQSQLDRNRNEKTRAD